MIVVDASAVLSFLLREPDASAFERKLMSIEGGLISVSSVMEIAMKLVRSGGAQADVKVDAAIALFDLTVHPIDLQQLGCARDAFLRYGKGMGHLAQLNFGDCFAYALAMERGEALLYKGEDFVHAGLMRLVGA